MGSSAQGHSRDQLEIRSRSQTSRSGSDWPRAAVGFTYQVQDSPWFGGWSVFIHKVWIGAPGTDREVDLDSQPPA